MGRNPENKVKYDNLQEALRWLRYQSGKSQTEVIEAVAENGGSLSSPYYSECERGVKYPSEKTLKEILKALDASDKDLKKVLYSKPWQKKTTSQPLRVRSFSSPASLQAPSSSSFSEKSQRLTSPGIVNPGINNLIASNDNLLASEDLEREEEISELEEVTSAWDKLGRNDQLVILSIIRK